jgi:hypothetical protein
MADLPRQARLLLSALLAPVPMLCPAPGYGDSPPASPALSVQNAPPTARSSGAFGPVFDWPIIPIHAILLPDGRVLSYGTDQAGQQGGQLKYDVWDPSLGRSPSAHLLLDNTTATDLFCDSQALIPATGQALLVGGSTAINGRHYNYASAGTSVFDYRSNRLSLSTQPMSAKRWYPTLVTLAGGQVAVLGGIAPEPGGSQGYSDTPEIFKPRDGWRSLTGAASANAYGAGNWYYPRAWHAPNGKVFILAHGGAMYYLDTAGTGAVAEATAAHAPASAASLPSAMFAPGKILSLRGNRVVSVVDISGAAPAVAATASLSQLRYYANATVLADGKVAVTGGSASPETNPNPPLSIAYAAETWDPATGLWSLGASAAVPRLYHSSALLLPDASLLTGGGGAPGPYTNLNAEIYYPPYLFKTDGSGQWAERPAIAAAPEKMGWNRAYPVTMATGAAIQRVTLLRMGSSTHAWNNEQRFQALKFTQDGKSLSVTAPRAANLAPPGYYLLFAFSREGTPSVGKIVQIAPSPWRDGQAPPE